MSAPSITAPPIDDRSTGSHRRGTAPYHELGERAREGLRRLLRGREADPAWSRPLLWLVGLLAGVLTLWGLTRNGYANVYYAEASQAASRNWWSWLSNSVDTSGLVSLDKGPLSNMLMGLSARLLGFSSFSMLLPEALCGIASVLLLHNIVRRTLGHRAALLAALMLALTPIFVAMSRFNNPDPLLVLCEIAAAWTLVRALESGRTRHLLLCGLFVGLAFNVKMLAAYLVVPGLALAFLVAGKGSVRRRVAQLAAGGGAMFVVSFVWYGAMMLVPAAQRPFVGDTTDNSWFSLIFGANGLNRVSGSGGGGPTGAVTFGGAPGITRLFNPIVGGQISWLLPLALLGLLLGLWARRRAPRTDAARSAYILWGGWGVVTWAIFSFSEGVFHPYYTTALAPAVAVLAAGGLVELWDRARRSIVWATALGAVAIGTAVWAAVLLARASGFVPWLAPAAIVLAALAGGALLLARVESVRQPHAPSPRVLLPFAAVAGLLSVLAGPSSYAIATVNDTLNGGNPLAGPASANVGLAGAPGRGFGGRGPSGPGDFPPGRAASGGRLPIQPPSGIAQPPGGASQGPPTGLGLPAGGPGGAAPAGTSGGGLPPAAVGGGAPGSRGAAGAGGAKLSGAVLEYLEAHQGTAKYMVAAVGSNIAGAIALQSARNVIDMGGFMGADPAPTLAQVQHLVDTGQLHYVLLGGGGARRGGPSGGGGPGGAGGSASSKATITARDRWIERHGTVVEVPGASTAGSAGTLYYIAG
ncbi:MAG TPA: glycosyltransferase family 39 protein [Solirubrobacteraceae bacterium]|jgi:4-amino-4-deoxy-L-arabinose transferase-like glycosyltransferase|nr:glycosyltransferase family 39 protein [Solirubrobacteraceae bacterium]